MPTLRTPAAAKRCITPDQAAPLAAATRTTMPGDTYPHHNMMHADSNDNMIFLTIPPAVMAGDITSTRRPRRQRHIPRRNSWLAMTQSI